MKITFVSNIYILLVLSSVLPRKLHRQESPNTVCVCVRTMNDNGQGTASDDSGDNEENDIVAEKRP